MAGLYTKYSADLDVSSFLDASFELNPDQFEKSALQIRGKLWSGRRYYRSYFEAGTDDLKVYGQGNCVVKFKDADSEEKKDHFAVIRDIWKHQPFKTSSCPSVFVFEVEMLLVCANLFFFLPKFLSFCFLFLFFNLFNFFSVNFLFSFSFCFLFFSFFSFAF